MIREAISTLVAGESLNRTQAAGAMDEIMRGEATPAQVAAFIVALRMKGESVDEIVGLAETMRQHSLRVTVSGSLIDTCGTGGDRSGSINISTTAALIVAGAGGRVAKHGNRSVSSHSGSADVLEALGVRTDLGPDAVARCIEGAGVGFMFAQVFHPSMRHAGGVRREIGVRTVFNILGPLTNPAGAQHQVVGVADDALVESMIQALRRLGSRHALVVHAEDGLDEVSLSGPTRVAELRDGSVAEFTIVPEQFGFRRVSPEAIRGGDAAENARVLRAVLEGVRGPARDVAVLNAGAALYAGDLAPDLGAGVVAAERAIDSGAARSALESFISLSQAGAG